MDTGSELLVRCARTESEASLWVLVWGSLTDVAQALHDAPDIAGKIRLMSIGGFSTHADPESRRYVYQHLGDLWPNLWWIENGMFPGNFKYPPFFGYWYDEDPTGRCGSQAFLQRVIRGRGTTSGGRFADVLGNAFPTGRQGALGRMDILKEGTMAMNTDETAMDTGFTAQLDRRFYDEPINRVRQNALTETDAAKLVLNQQAIMNTDRVFSTRLDDWEVTNQKRSGRCWLFAATNLLRSQLVEELKIKNFEFSQNWLLFWDKYEKANFFLESVIATADLDIDDRTVVTIFSNCVTDGGQWTMFVNLVRKYGLVPKTSMPETTSSSATASMNKVLVGRLRVGAKTLRDMASAGESSEKITDAKRTILSDVYTVLRLHLGNPPTSFVWQWQDKDKEFHREPEMTPLQFAERYVRVPLEEYICLVHDPRQICPYGKTLSVEHLGNVIEGGAVVYLNVDIDHMKNVAVKALKRGEPVWFGCDMGKMMHKDRSIMDSRLFGWEDFYGMPVEMESKRDRLLYGRTAMNHAMLFTGVDEVDDEPVKWRVENSWGDIGAEKGFFVMSDQWFDENMFEVAVRKSDLPKDLQKAVDIEPVVLPAWDPMGALAGG